MRWFGIANDEWISNITHQTTANGCVVNHIALGVEATGARTRIATLLVDAGLMAGTLCIDGTLGTTAGWRTEIVWQAGTRGNTSYVATL